MRILQVHTHYRQAGGEDAVVAAESRLLRAAGHEVVEWRNTNPASTVGAIRMLSRSAWNRGTLERFEQETAGDFDVAHVHNTWFATTPSILSDPRGSWHPGRHDAAQLSADVCERTPASERLTL